MTNAYVLVRFGRFPCRFCEICGRPALILVASTIHTESDHYFCEDHVAEANAVRRRLAQEGLG